MADWAVVFAKTDLTAKGSKGISMFVVDMKLPGVSLGAHEKKMGINGYPTCDLVLEDVRVSKDCLVGPLHKGFQIAMKTLDGGRLGIAAQSVGIAQSALDEAVKYAKERKQFGRRIADFQGISFMLADMAADVEAARQLVYHAAVLKDANSPEASSACSIAKYFAAEAANRCAYKGRADPRRLRLYPRVQGGAHLPRRPHHHHLRGHLSGAADGHRRQSAEVSKEVREI